MTIHALMETANAMVADGKGLLAMDESTGTCNRRFASAGIPQTEEARRAYRELLVCTPGLAQYISGAILFDETIHQRTTTGVPFTKVLSDAGIIAGIKVDLGAQALAGHPGEKVTEGLDGLRLRLTTYYSMGARFAKWRAVITPGTDLPSAACMDANAHALARYAALCQEASLVPIVEPEVLMDGDHTLERCSTITHELLLRVFDQLDRQGVILEAMILKPNMVLPGLSCALQPDAETIAEATVSCLLRSVPAAVAGITFLSGGQSAEQASARLNAMHQPRFSIRRPWPLSFSFARALQQPVLAAWAGDDAHRTAAQAALLHRAQCNSAALRGEYRSAMEDA
ncbi:class I fructose-bisphosphate aldolase [Pusillimonas sp. ANT_WB101]|uniref:class I fructose-bisphosphate aldolase n=1 Tax=Pusillimonas sp. ANT_WB101 TaxID=2597356 RepID=UPI0011EC2B70|nr:class I fructose-bisphosphate aldolase [Pusillimonas sp. ANT_WB101]KAA0890614.1 fructose-bisphosphate aldolase class I [Pusillimonas sp. ANT_WB101]